MKSNAASRQPRCDTGRGGPHLNGMETLTMTTTLLEPPRTQVQPPPAAARSPLLPAFALAEHLEALAGCVDRVSDADYLTPAADGGVTGPVGARVRQRVDFVLALLDRPAG